MVGASLALAILVRVPVFEPVRFVLGMLVGLAIPGYLLTGLLFPLREQLREPERVAISLALNVAAIIVMTLLMALWKIPLTTITLDNGLSGFVSVLAIANLAVRRQYPQDKLAVFRLPRSKAAYFTLSVMVGLSLLVWGVVHASLTARSLAFSITNSQGLLQGYPYQLRVGQKYPLVLHVMNPGPNSLNGVVTETVGKRLIWQSPITVLANRRWRQTITLPSRNMPPTVHVQFALKNVQGGVMRQLWITYQMSP